MVRKRIFAMLMGIVVLMMGCTGGQETAVSDPPQTTTLTLPALDAAELNGEPLKVVATTSIIGDVVAQVGGETIELTTLMGAGQDPHTFQPGAQALTAVSQADVIFINGWDLEESLVQDLERISEGVPIVTISANIEPLAADEDAHSHEGEPAEEDEAHGGGSDPHVWFSIANVKQWAENAAQVLSERDPAHAQIYKGNTAAYLAELDALQTYAEEQFAQITTDKRYLVTNHDSLSYLAHDYEFELIGTVIPAASTLAEPSASDLAALIAEMEEHNVCTIFTEATVSDTLAQTVAAELSSCESVQVLPLYTGAVGPAGSGADSYTGMFRANVDTIVEGLR